MNINEYVPVLINALDTIVGGGNVLSSSPLAVGYLLHAASEYCILLML